MGRRRKNPDTITPCNLNWRELLPQNIDENGQVSDVLLSNGKIGRSLLISFNPHNEEHNEEEGEHDSDSQEEQGSQTPASAQTRIRLQVAAPLSEIHNVITIATRQVLIVTASALIGATVLLWPVTTIMLHPISQLSQQLKQLHPDELDRRIDIVDCPTELRPVVNRLNDFMVQLQDAFERERTTTANISHELRTPIAGLKAILEVAASRPRSAGDYQQTIHQANEILTQLEGLMERVLLLARLDAGTISLIAEDCDVTKLLHEIADELQITQNINWQLVPECFVLADNLSLSQIIRNLLSNAVSYTTDRSGIIINAKQTATSATIEFVNPSQPIPPSDLEKLKQRFYQADPNRIRVSQSVGLGLSICNELATHMNGTLELSQQNGFFCARLSLPIVSKTSTKLQTAN